jgi:uncharacterized glyoxalase superfamily protein PhnB
MMVKSMTPNLIVKDVYKTMEFYVTVLDFNFAMAIDRIKNTYMELTPEVTYLFGMVGKGDVVLFIQAIESFKEDVTQDANIETLNNNISLYIEIDDVDSYFESIKESVEIIAPIRETFYGMREFYIRDLDGNIIGFSQKLQ